MSHVDDGTLHAFFDGELSSMETVRLEAHLAECAACRARLEEERALIERAGQLLSLAAPPARAMPPLHQLRHPQPRLSWRLPLAWAATVVLALAAGWYVRGLGVAEYGLRAPSEDAQAPVYNLSSVDTGSAIDSALTPLAPSAARGRLAERQEQAREADRPVDQVAVALADRAPRESAAAGAGVASAAPPPAPVAGVVAQDAARESRVAVAVEAKSGMESGEAIAEDSARRLLGTDLAVIPGYPVTNIRRLPGGALQVEQQLDSTTVITLRQWSADAAPDVRRIEQAASERLARFVRGLRVEISGPLAADSLSRLLESVR